MFFVCKGFGGNGVGNDGCVEDGAFSYKQGYSVSDPLLGQDCRHPNNLERMPRHCCLRRFFQCTKKQMEKRKRCSYQRYLSSEELWKQMMETSKFIELKKCSSGECPTGFACVLGQRATFGQDFFVFLFSI